jgi:hypothetical protein
VTPVRRRLGLQWRRKIEFTERTKSRSAQPSAWPADPAQRDVPNAEIVLH